MSENEIKTCNDQKNDVMHEAWRNNLMYEIENYSKQSNSKPKSMH